MCSICKIPYILFCRHLQNESTPTKCNKHFKPCAFPKKKYLSNTTDGNTFTQPLTYPLIPNFI